MPASTMKMLTSAAAFERFGPRYQFSTDVLYDGTLGSDGTLTGNVYLRGDGDPSLSGRYMAGGPGAPMNFLADQLVSRTDGARVQAGGFGRAALAGREHRRQQRDRERPKDFRGETHGIR